MTDKTAVESGIDLGALPDARVRGALSAGIVVATVGVLVMFGWHTGNTMLTSVARGYRPMVYTTAVGFLLSGLALVALAVRMRFVAAVFGLIVASVGLFRTAEHVLGLHSFIDSLTPSVPAVEILGRMAPMSAGGFALIGLSLLELSRPARRRRPRLIGLAAAVVSGIGAVAVAGYLLGDPAYIWGPMTGMAVHSAAGFILVGAGLILLAWAGDENRRLADFSPVLVLAAGLTATFSLSQAFATDQASVRAASLRLHAVDLAGEATAAVQTRADAILRMARRLEAMPEMRLDVWTADARLYLSHYPGLVAIARTGHPDWTVPEGMLRPAHPGESQASPLSRAVESLAASPARVVGLPGGPGHADLLLPAGIGAPGDGSGALVGILSLGPLLDAIWADELAAGHEIVVRSHGSVIYARNLAASSVRLPEVPAKFGGESWSLALGAAAADRTQSSRLPLAAVVVGVLMSGLLAMLMHLFRRSRARLHQVQEAHRLLQRETAGREETNRALVASDARFRATSETSPLGLFLTDKTGSAIYVNEAYVRIIGLSREEALGYGWTNALHSADRDGVMHRARQAMADRADPADVSLYLDAARFVHPDGTLVETEVKIAPVIEAGRITGFAGALEDVTDRRRSEREVRERTKLAAFAADVGAALTRRESLHEALADCARAMVNHLGGATASIWMVDEAEQMLDLQGCAGFGALFPDFQSRVPVGKYRLGRIVRDRKPQLVNLDTETPEEDDRDWARNRGMVCFIGYPLIARNRVAGVLTMFADHHLTETTLYSVASVADQIALAMDRARALVALAASEARTRSIIQNMLVGLITSDRQAVIETINPAGERMFGYEPGELVGRSLALLMAIPVGQEAATFLHEAYPRAINRVTEWEARRKDGGVFPIELSLFAFETPEGPRYAGSIRDISERREVDRMKKEFVSTVSHELRTPLTSIRGSLGLLSGGALGELSGDARDLIAISERNVERLMALINDLLDLERFDSGRFVLEMSDVPVATLFARSADSVAGFAAQTGVRIQVRPSPARVRGDPDRLVQVLVNLLSNAIKFSPPGSAVVVEARGAADGVEIRVIDEGRGIPDSFRGAIFQRFRQVEASDARGKGGTGLGLAICKAIVEQHGGSIGVESTEGHGSTFWIRVPAAVSELLPAAANPAEATP